jgi:hypothetical protein
MKSESILRHSFILVSTAPTGSVRFGLTTYAFADEIFGDNSPAGEAIKFTAWCYYRSKK